MYAIDESDGSDPEALNFENVISKFENRTTTVKAEPTIADMRAAITGAINESPGSVDRYIQIAKSSSPATWDEGLIRRCYADLTQEGGQ